MYLVSRLANVKNSFVRSTTGIHVHRTSFGRSRYFSSTCKLSSDEYIVNCPYEEAFIPDTDIYTHVFRQFSEHGRKTALIDGVTGRKYSYNEVQESVVNYGIWSSEEWYGEGRCTSTGFPQQCRILYHILLYTSHGRDSEYM